MIYTLVLKIISGAVVGYTTNDLALRMLFDRVLGIPSVVEQTKTVFINNISQLVESEIIRHDNIKEELKKPAFRKALMDIFEEMIQKSINEQFADSITIDDTPGIQHSVKKFRRVVENKLEKPLETLLTQLIEDNNISIFFSEQQLEYTSQQLYKQLFQLLSQEELLTNFLQDLWLNIKDKPLEDFLNQELTEQLTQISIKLYRDIRQDIANGTYPLEVLTDKLIEHIDIDELLTKLADSLAGKKITEILGNEQAEATIDEILQIVIDLVQDERDNHILKRITYILIDVISQQGTTMFELLPDSISLKVEEFMRENLPSVLEVVISWIRSNKHDIDVMVNDAFAKNASWIGGWLIKLFVDSVSDRFKVVDEIVAITRKHQEEEGASKIAEKGTEYVINYFKQHHIGELIDKINKEALVENILKYIQEYFKEKNLKVNIQAFTPFLEQELGAFWAEERRVSDLKRVLSYLKDEELINKLLLSDAFSQKLETKIIDKIQNIRKHPLSDFISEEMMTKSSLKIQEHTSHILQSQKDNVQGQLYQLLSDKTKKLKWSKIINLNTVSIWTENLNIKLSRLLQRFYDDNKQTPVKQVTQKLSKAETLPEQLVNLLSNYLDKNLNKLMKGQVSKSVSKSLHVKHKELPKMVKGFMGKNMQPITYFGAFLGAIAGMFTVPIQFSTEEPNNLLLAAGAMVYGLTGLGTNWIAIKMIFKPYTARFIGKMRIPFTPGIMTRNKPTFALKMGNFVGEELLNKETVQNDLFGKLIAVRPLIERKATNKVYIQQIIEANKDLIAKQSTKWVEKLITDKQQELSNGIYDIIIKEEKKLTEGNIGKAEQVLQQITHSPKFDKSLSDFLVDKLFSILEKDDTIGNVIPQSMHKALFNGIAILLSQEIDNLINKMEGSEIPHKVKQEFYQLIEKNKTLPLNEISYFSQRKENIKKAIHSFIDKKLLEDEFVNTIFQYIDKELLTVIGVEHTFYEAFDGKLFQLVNKNIDNLIKQFVRKICHYLDENRDYFASEVYQAAYSKNRLAFLYEKTIKQSTNDLIHEDLPIFFDDRLQELTPKLTAALEQIAQNTQIKDLGIELEKTQIIKTIQQTLSNHKVQMAIYLAVNKLIEEIYKTPLNQFVPNSLLNERAIYRQLTEITTPEIAIVKTHLKTALYKNNKKDTVINTITSELENILGNKFFTKKISFLTQGIDNESLRNQINTFIQNISQTKAFSNIKDTLIKRLLQEVSDKGLDILIDKSILKQDLGTGLAKILEDSIQQNNLHLQIKSLSYDILSEFHHILTPELKSYGIKVLMDATVSASKTHISAVVNSINFRGIVEDEIQQMDAAKIEELFYGFAGVYFQRLILYGLLLGCPLGIIIDFGLQILLDYLKQ